VLVIAVFVTTGFVAAPLTAVMVPTIVVLGPLHGSLWTLVGATASGALFFWLGARGSALAGRLGARPALKDRVTRLLEGNGILAVALARNLPLAPYPIVNLALGASPLRLPDFLVGNLLGLLPWVALYAAAGAELRPLLESPSPRSLVVAGISIACLVVVAAAARRLATRLLARPRPTGEPPAG
jgi:phospholipase D1/2